MTNDAPAGDDRVSAIVADPQAHFATPEAVVHDETLTLDEKRRVLESWRTDAELLSSAQAENMGGGESARLREVELALAQLRSPR